MYSVESVRVFLLMQVGDCVAKDSYPDGNITWYRNGQVLLPVDGGMRLMARIFWIGLGCPIDSVE